MDDTEYGDELFIYAMALTEEMKAKETQNDEEQGSD